MRHLVCHQSQPGARPSLELWFQHEQGVVEGDAGGKLANHRREAWRQADVLLETTRQER